MENPSKKITGFLLTTRHVGGPKTTRLRLVLLCVISLVPRASVTANDGVL